MYLNFGKNCNENNRRSIAATQHSNYNCNRAHSRRDNASPISQTYVFLS